MDKETKQYVLEEYIINRNEEDYQQTERGERLRVAGARAKNTNENK